MAHKLHSDLNSENKQTTWRAEKTVSILQECSRAGRVRIITKQSKRQKKKNDIGRGTPEKQE